MTCAAITFLHSWVNSSCQAQALNPLPGVWGRHDLQSGRLSPQNFLRDETVSAGSSWSVCETRQRAIVVYGVAARRLGLQAFGGLPRLAEISPCESAAFRRMPAFFMASVRSGPAGMRRAGSRATNASASKSNLDRGFFLSWDIEILRHVGSIVTSLVPQCRFGARHRNRRQPPGHYSTGG